MFYLNTRKKRCKKAKKLPIQNLSLNVKFYPTYMTNFEFCNCMTLKKIKLNVTML